MTDSLGCTNHGCVLAPDGGTSGMRTSGRCRCVEDAPAWKLKSFIRAQTKKIQMLEEEVALLRAQLDEPR